MDFEPFITFAKSSPGAVLSTSAFVTAFGIVVGIALQRRFNAVSKQLGYYAGDLNPLAQDHFCRAMQGEKNVPTPMMEVTTAAMRQSVELRSSISVLQFSARILIGTVVAAVGGGIAAAFWAPARPWVFLVLIGAFGIQAGILSAIRKRI